MPLVEPKGVLVTSLEDKPTFFKTVCDELKINDISVEYKPSFEDAQDEGPINDEPSYKTFGIPLHQCPLSKFYLETGHEIKIPSVLLVAYNIIEGMGMTRGLFRISSNERRKKEIMNRLEEGGTFLPHDDIHDIVGVVKQFFYNLPNMILSDDGLQKTLRQCLSTEIYSKRCLRLVLILLPELELYVLASFLQLIRRLLNINGEEHMDAYGFAVCIAPSLMPLFDSKDSNQMNVHIKILELLIEDANKIGIVPQRTLIQYCFERKKSRKIESIPNDMEEITLYFFLNKQPYCKPFIYRTYVGMIKAGVGLKNASGVQLNGLSLYEMNGKPLKNTKEIYDEAAYVLLSKKEKFEPGEYSETFRNYILQRLNKNIPRLVNVEKYVKALEKQNAIEHDQTIPCKSPSCACTFIKPPKYKPMKRVYRKYESLKLDEKDIGLWYRRYKPEPPKKKPRTSKLSDEALKNEVKQAKLRMAELAKKEKEKQSAKDKLEKDLEKKPRIIYDPASVKQKKLEEKNKQKPIPKKKKQSSVSKVPSWKSPTPVGVIDLLKYKTEIGRLKRGLPMKPPDTKKQKAKKPDKKRKSDEPSRKSWEQPPAIPVKGTEKALQRSESIRKQLEPIDSKEYVAGIKAVHKNFQVQASGKASLHSLHSLPYTKEPEEKKENAENEKKEAEIQSENMEPSSEPKKYISEKSLQVEQGRIIDNDDAA